MPNNGWISLHRKIQNHWIWDNEEKFDKRSAWVDILLMVNHEKRKVNLGNELLTVESGERITSERKLAKRWNWSRTKVRNFLDLLKKDNMIEFNKIPQKRTRLKVLNYSDYQNIKNQIKTSKKPEEDHKRTSKEPQKDLNNNDNNDNKIHIHADEIEEIYSCWKDLLSDVNNARLTKKTKKLIATKLKKWDKEDIKQSIKNYNEIYRSDYYYSHNWTLQKFIKQSNGATRFQPGLDQEYDGDIWKDYKNNQDEDNTGKNWQVM
ncbi:MAG: hypothetical protein K9K32_04570 [Halanaerobiales bacterium]|nr:hypothetical protein [Halanaerobiales bacterium]